MSRVTNDIGRDEGLGGGNLEGWLRDPLTHREPVRLIFDQPQAYVFILLCINTRDGFGDRPPEPLAEKAIQ